MSLFKLFKRILGVLLLLVWMLTLGLVDFIFFILGWICFGRKNTTNGFTKFVFRIGNLLMSFIEKNGQWCE